METKNNLALLASQRIVISPQQRYSLYLLGMNNLELTAYVKQVMEENPFLKDNSEDNFDEYSLCESCGQASFLENIPSNLSYKDEILQHFAFLRLNDMEKDIALMLIDNIVECKYVNNEMLQEISKAKNISYSDLLQIIKKLHILHPTVLFAFNLKDKIRIAFERGGKCNNDHKVLIQNLDLVLTHGMSVLKHRYGFDENRMSGIISDLKSICFDSNQCFDNDLCQYKIPDVFIGENHESFMNDSTMPHISIDTELHSKMIGKSRSSAEIKYVKEKISSAKVLARAINDRKSTILRVVKEIAYRQQSFLFERNSLLMPINVKSLANALILHESTVHRAISGKSVDTPKGIFDLKTFLPHKVKTSDEQAELSDHAVKEYIKKIVHNEPQDSPYTDNHIVDFLRSRGVEISRRTVSKYRNKMDIPNASRRVRSYAILGCE